jgi:hypothetical protein
MLYLLHRGATHAAPLDPDGGVIRSAGPQE